MTAGNDVHARIRKATKGGIPWFAMTDSEIDALRDSLMPAAKGGAPTDR